MLLVASLTFVLVHLAPGDPFAADPSRSGVSESVRAQRRAHYGFDQPLPVQYGRWLWNVARGDLGQSLSLNVPVTRALLSVVPKRDPRDRGTPQILRGETPNSIHIPPGCRFNPRCPMAIAECKTVDPELRRPAASRDPEHRAACIRV